MSLAEVVLVVALLFTAALYWWVGKMFVSQPRFNHPAIFWNQTVAKVLVFLPYLGFIAISIGGFTLTDHGWWFLGAVVALFVAFAVKPAEF